MKTTRLDTYQLANGGVTFKNVVGGFQQEPPDISISLRNRASLPVICAARDFEQIGYERRDILAGLRDQNSDLCRASLGQMQNQINSQRECRQEQINGKHDCRDKSLGQLLEGIGNLASNSHHLRADVRQNKIRFHFSLMVDWVRDLYPAFDLAGCCGLAL